jgi:heat shock protein HslJ
MKPRIANLPAPTLLLVSACAGNKGALEDTHWNAVTIGGAPVVVPQNREAPYILLQSDANRVAAFGGCNRLSGTFEIEGEKLTLSRMASTMMACESGMEQEQALHDALNRVARWRMSGGRLELLDIGGEAVATFEAR